MARRPSRSLTLVLTTLLVVSCSPGNPVAEGPSTRPSTTTTVPSTPSSTSPTTTTTAPSPTTTAPAATTTIPPAAPAPGIDAEVGVPSGLGPFPAVVLAHGGAWLAGDPSILRPLASYLEDNGFLTVNTRYELATFENPSFPEAVDDITCAVRFAASHPSSDGTVAVIGHSAGAHLGAIVALTGEDYGDDCPHGGSGVPSRFVGLAGPYDISRLGPAPSLLFGAGPNVLPAEWAAGNPQRLTDRNPELNALIMYGEFDGVVDDSFAFEFHGALVESGAESLLELVEGARHNEMHDPAMVGDLIVTWLDR